MTELDAIFFDLGDTLIDLREGDGDYMARVGVRAECVYDAIAPLSKIPLPDRVEFTEKLVHGTEAFYLAAVARQQGVDIYDALRSVFEELGMPVNDTCPTTGAGGLVEAAGNAYCRGSAALAPLRAGAGEVLAALHDRGLRLGVISNTLQPAWSMDGALARRGLLHFFAARIYSSEVRVAKPHAAIFHAALNALGVVPDRAIHVGDRLVADVAGAQAVGMRAVLLEAPHRPEPDSDIVPDARIRELPELLDMLTE
jgi:HAD superfamily hydrolase (TIGR01509 family)